MGEHNLLVIDWDYFFPQPRDGGDIDTDLLGLYDWQHAEVPFMIEMVWDTRAASFLQFGKELPRCQGYKGFWDRFTITPGAPLAYADSNSYAGLLRPGGDRGWDSVWLFDAHHDCGGYGHDTLGMWRTRQTFSCEDWMVVHGDLGSKLHVRYPEWKIHGLTIEPEPLVPVDRQMDDGKPVDVEFGTVFLCRSGAWVPPWCDDQFTELIETYPGPRVNIDERYPQMHRPFRRETAENIAALTHEFRRTAESSDTADTP